MKDLNHCRAIRDLLGPSGDLYMRLRGFYPIGPPGTHEPEFGYRDFRDSPLRQPIQMEAADHMEAQALAYHTQREAIATIFAEGDPFTGIGASSYAKADRVLELLAAPRLTAAPGAEIVGLHKALSVIAELPSSPSEDVMRGHEEAYRTIENILKAKN